MFLWQLFPDSLQGDFQLINRLQLLVVYGSFAAWGLRRPAGSNLETFGPLMFLSEPGTVRLVLRE